MIRKIISGGQTGVDRAALDTGLELGIPVGGACPKGRRAEDGPIDTKYPLEELSSSDYVVRTRKNVADSDGTLILYIEKLTGGTALTKKCAEKLHKPYLAIDLNTSPQAHEVLQWLGKHAIETLNIAGPRESKHPGICQQAHSFLRNILKLVLK